jgi:threonylcarbamoyladenosine tRNA methylthiotransferase MtaB
MRRAALHNLGCKVNGYELDVMTQQLRQAGYEIVPFEEPADVYVINTCTVTNIADRKSRQMIHRAKKQNPGAVVVAVGCYVETDPKEVEQDSCIDLAIGNNRKGEIAKILMDYLADRQGGKRGGQDPLRGDRGRGAEPKSRL